MTKLLTIEDKEWVEAEEYFKKNKNIDEVKKSKTKFSKTEHSFIKIPIKNEKGIEVGYNIYAMASMHYVGAEGENKKKDKSEVKYANLGEGAYGKIKVVQNRNGENFAVKIEKGRHLRTKEEIRIKELLKLMLGQQKRVFATITLKDKTQIREKLYTIMPLEKGKDLEKSLYIPNVKNIKKRGKRSYVLTDTQRLLIANKICNTVNEKLHKLGIIHADLKPANLMADINDNQIVISAVDLDFALQLKNKSDRIMSQKAGTPYYMAPELNPTPWKKWYVNDPPVPFSFASDIYALGRIFKKDMKLPKSIWKGMLKKDPSKRDTLNTVMKNINIELQKNSRLNEILKNCSDALTNILTSTPPSKNTRPGLFFSPKEEKIQNLSYKFHKLFLNKENLNPEEKIKKALKYLNDNKKNPLLRDTCKRFINKIEGEITYTKDLKSKTKIHK